MVSPLTAPGFLYGPRWTARCLNQDWMLAAEIGGDTWVPMRMRMPNGLLDAQVCLRTIGEVVLNGTMPKLV